jgi:FkbM family methyltransferase
MTVAFILANSAHGALIVNRLDYNLAFNNQIYGVGAQILSDGAYERSEIEFVKGLLNLRRKHFGDGVVMLDCGANIGVHMVECAGLMQGWGKVLAIEAQERLFYALCGNIALHNCFNARAIWGAITSNSTGIILAPEPDYTQPASFGSFELVDRVGRENIGQDIDYQKLTVALRCYCVDGLIDHPVYGSNGRLDLLKIDVEGMEMDVLRGAEIALAESRPIVVVETIKSDKAEVESFLKSFSYEISPLGMNTLAMHRDDPCREHVTVREIKAA